MTDNKEFVVSKTEEDPRILQERFQELGYLFFKGALAAEKCEGLLNDLLGILKPIISRPESTPLFDGTPFFETDPEWDELYPKIQSLESFHSFFHDSSVNDLMSIVAGTDTFVYPIKMARISTPGKIGYETPPHQDAYSHAAGDTMAGIWIPLHDISSDMGRVKVLPGSHKSGVRPVFEAQGVGGVQCEIYPEETTWHVSDSQQGDVLIFHSCTVHKAEPNVSSNKARLSVDTRFCDFGAPVHSNNLAPHHGWRIDGLCWESIYQNWEKEDYQFYWESYPNVV